MPGTSNTTPGIRDLDTFVENLNVLYTGQPGFGKSTGVISDATPICLGESPLYGFNRPAIVGLDEQGSTVFGLASQLVAKFLDSEIIYEQLHATAKALGSMFVPDADVPDPVLREMLNNETVRGLMTFLMNRRSVGTLADRPVIEEGVHLCLSAMVGQPCPFWLAPYLCYRGTAEYRYLMSHVRDRDTALKIQAAERLPERDYEFKMGPARRLLEGVCRSPVFRGRCYGPFDMKSALRERKIILLEGGGIGVDPDDYLTVAGSWIVQVYKACREHFAETGKPLHVILILEEGRALITPFLNYMLAKGRKYGLKIWVVIQGLPPAEILDDFLEGFGTHVAHRTGSYNTAKLIANSRVDGIDFHAVHHTTDRLQHAGYEGVDHVTHSKSTQKVLKSPDKITEGTSRSTSERAKYEKVTDNQYWQSGDLILKEIGKLMSYDIGERSVKDRFGVRTEFVTKLEEPWAFGATREETQKRIDAIRSQPLYQPPILQWNLTQSLNRDDAPSPKASESVLTLNPATVSAPPASPKSERKRKTS